MIFFKYMWRRNHPFSNSYRSFSLNTSEAVHESSKSESHSNAKHATEVYEYMKDNKADDLFKDIPAQFLHKKQFQRFILINPSIAKKISSALKQYLKESYILESDPGFGLLSKELIHTVSYLRLYEEDHTLRSYLRELSDKHQNKVEVFDSSLQSIQKLQFDDHIDNGNRMTLLFDDIPTDINLNMIVIAPYKDFVSKWIRHILNKDYFSKFSKLNFYFFLSPSVYTRLVALPQNEYYPRYQKFSVISQVLFDTTLIMNDIPRKAFLPWPKRQVTKQNSRNMEKYENDHEVVYLVRMSLKSENLNQLLEENMCQCFSSFVNQNMTGKKRLVSYFETIIPGSGPRVILLGHNIYSAFNELSPDEIFSLFLEFIKWPEFKNTAFYSYWKHESMFGDQDASTNSLQSHHDDLHDEDDNDDDAFLPGNKIK